MSYPPEHYEGLRLFNTGHYWHAHEQWEHCWLAVSGDDARCYKALIQAAAALVKWRQNNRRGLGLNWAKSRALLLTLPAYHFGLNLVLLREQFEQFVAGELAEPPLLVAAPDKSETPPLMPS